MFFRQMDDFDFYSFGIVIRFCVGLVVVRQGKEVYGQYVRKGGQGYVIVELVLVDFYVKCGCIDYV